jgi:hypothetical protein
MGFTRLMRSGEATNFIRRILVFRYKGDRFLGIRSGRFCTFRFNTYYPVFAHFKHLEQA